MKFSELSTITKGELHLFEDVEISHFSTDSRTIHGNPGEVFIAINASRDGHNYIAEASSLGIKNFIVEKSDTVPNGGNALVVKNSLSAFQEIAAHHRKQFDIPVIGITGSNGKTSVKEWLSTLLSEKHFVAKNPKSFNSQLGVPISVIDLTKNHEIGVFEAGISQINEMAHLEKIICPTIGIFTTLGQAHNEGFESMEQKLDEKLKLFSNSEKVIYRSDQDYSAQVKAALGAKGKSWALDGSGDIKIEWRDGSICVDNLDLKIGFENRTELENATHAIIASVQCGLDAYQIQNGLNLLNSIPMRLEFKKGINGCYILDDSYNNDLAGLKVALDHFESHRENDKKALILSDILQSGIDDKVLYQKVSELIQNKGIGRLIGVGPRISNQKDSFLLQKEFFSTTEELLDNFPDFESEMILVKGARDFALERVSNRLEEKLHGTVLEVNFEALRHNLNQYRNLLEPTTKIMAMVKANAYGSGLMEVANFLQHQRVDQLGVAYVDEAIGLRKNGIKLPIMIMNPYIDSFREFERYDLQAEIFSLNHLNRLLQDTKGTLSIQVKIDTGMHRLGFGLNQLPELVDALKKNKRIRVEGIFTHFSSSDDPKEDAFTRSQAAVFEEVYDTLSSSIGYAPNKHACNSPAMVRWPQYHYDMVRLGIGLHGFDPTGQLKLKPTSQLKTVISQIQQLPEGSTVGYSRKGLLNRDSKIAVLPIGYEDGYSRIFGNGKAQVSIGSKLCETVGNVCMDMIMVDVTDIEAKEGDEAIIFGTHPSIQQLAEWAGTIPYEILTNVSSRVKRVFVWE